MKRLDRMGLGVLRWRALVVFCFLVLWPAGAAGARFVIRNVDPPGQGFNDPRPVEPIGGNPGRTRGEQALKALEHAAASWGEQLDSDVPIVVEARFQAQRDKFCAPEGVTLARTGPTTAYANFRHAPWRNVLYPVALANRLAGEDLNDDAPEMTTHFNGSLGTADCQPHRGWYFGLDGDSAGAVDFVRLALHELAHGLGVANMTNLTTGEFLRVDAEPLPDIHSMFVYDATLGRFWDELDPRERRASASNVFRLVWGGAAVRAAASAHLKQGVPSLEVSSNEGAFFPLIGTASFGEPVPTEFIEGELRVADDGATDPSDACEPLVGPEAPIVLADGGRCDAVTKALNASAAGAQALLIAQTFDGPVPASVVGVDRGVDITVASVTRDAGERIQQALTSQGQLTAELGFDVDRSIGTDQEGRLYLNATDPPRDGTTLDHWHPLATPDLLMEPNSSEIQGHELDVTLAQLRDLGWFPFECGDGFAEGEEECDAGEANSDTAAGACRTDCRLPRCGDGVRDRNEHCDDGNREDGDACPASCRRKRDGGSDGGLSETDGAVDARAPSRPNTPADSSAAMVRLDAAEATPQATSDAGTSQPPGDCGPGCRKSPPRSENSAPRQPDAVPVGHDNEGCSCRTAGRQPSSRRWAWLTAALALLTRMRRGWRARASLAFR